jgi:hypothetical protein
MGMEHVYMMDCGDAVRRADNGCFGKGPYAKTAAYTISQYDAGKVFSNTGATGTVVFTLPAAKAGLWFAFLQQSGYDITVTAGAGSKINGGSAAGSISVPGWAIRLVVITSDGTDWYTDAEQNQFTVEVALTNANIKALRATPITLVAAPGTGRMIEFVRAVIFLDYGSNALTESTDDMAIKYENGSGSTVSEAIEATGFIDATADTRMAVNPATSAVIAKSACENKALVLHNTGDGEYAGNATADTVMRVRTTYRVHKTNW